ncbi:MAG: hypothetical protein ABW178_08130 [Pseudoxanthomonas sp.]
MRVTLPLALMSCVLLAACSGEPPPQPADPSDDATVTRKPPAPGDAASSASATSTAPPQGPVDAPARQEMDARVERVLGDAAGYRSMVATLKQAVAARDAVAVAALVHYPLEARIAGKRVEVNDAAQFQAQYAQLMVPEIVRAIERQDYDQAMVNQQGIMLGDGQVWISGVCATEDCSDHPPPQVVTLQTTSS